VNSIRLSEETLERVSRGQGSFPELATALESFSRLVMILPPKPAPGLRQLWSAIGAPTETVPQSQSEEDPDPLGERNAEGGLGPYVFTTEARARSFLAGQGLAPYPGPNLRSQSWAGGVAEFLKRGYSGMILDPASQHALALDRRGLSRLYAQLTLEHLAGLSVLRVVMVNQKFHAQKAPQGAGLQAFVYDSRESAAFGLPRLPGGGVALSTRDAPTREFLRRALSAGITYLVVNPAAPGERIYDKADLERMVETVRTAPTGMREAQTLRKRALETPSLSPRPLTGRPEEACRAALFALKEQVAIGVAEPWQFMEALAYEADVLLPVAAPSGDGLLWPEPHAITRAEAARRLPQKAIHLSGLEALRWLWSAPNPGNAVVLGGSETFPLDWAAMVLFPAASEIADLRKVPIVSHVLLGRLPGARGLKPQALRALALHWKDLVKFQEPHMVNGEGERDGMRYLPLFCSLRSLAAFRFAPQGFAGTPDPAGSVPPFTRWLPAAARCDGLLLEAAAGGAPLPLDHTDLLVLQAWATNPLRAPQSSEIIREAGRLLDAQILTQELAGRIAADLPRYWIARRGAELFRFPGTDGCCLFTSEADTKLFLEKARTLDVDVDFQPAPLTSRWHQNAFLTVAQESSDVWICPEDPLFGGGLHLTKDGLLSALRRLDEGLKPRVPGFVV